MDIGEAVKALNEGKMVTRAGWNGKGMWLALEGARTMLDGRLLLPHIVMSTAGGDRVPWVASHTDLLGIDWVVV